MARTSDMPESLVRNMMALECPTFAEAAWAEGPPLGERRVAIVTTSGLSRRGDRPFGRGAADYRIIPGDLPARELVMSHVSVNYDRTGFQRDHNVVFPIDRLADMAAAGEIGSVAAWHYSFMGATDPAHMEPAVREIAGLLKQDRVDAVLLTPV